MSFLDMDEALIELSQKADLVYSPVMDVKEFPENVDVCLVEGAVCNEDHLELLHKIRQRSRIVVSFGDCAVTGNVSAIRNQLGLANTENVLQRAYLEAAQFNGCIPCEDGVVPPLLQRVQPLHEAVHIDRFLPGCPPSAQSIKAMVIGLLEGGGEPENARSRFG
jgi:NAD-reducing hydrogenase small subunit